MSSQWPMSHQADSHPAADSAPEASLGRDDNAQEEQREHGLPDPQIIDLSAGRDSSTAGPPELLLRQEILQGLTRDSLLVPGLAPADRLFACSKAIPTVVLYDNLGLELYDQITAVEDYYPFATELGILRAKSYEIACRLGGISTASISKRDDDPFLPAEEQREMNGVHSATLIQPGGEVPECPSSSPVQVTGFPLTIIELGAGSLKKTSHLLGNVARLLQARKGARTGECFSEAKYYALDLQLEQLKSTLSRIQVQKESGVGPQVGRQVQSYGICGTYQQGLEWISKSMTGSNQAKPAGIGQVGSRKAILWLGSSIGNFSPTEAVQFLRDEIGRALDSTTRVLIGIDNCQVPEKVQLAYDDRQGVTKKFILNGITVVARHLGLPEGVFTPEDFDYVSRYNVGMRRNEAYLRARRGMRFEIPAVEAEVGTEDHQTSPLIEIQAGELIMIEKSYKYSADEAYQLFDQAGLRVIQKWSDSPDPVSPTHTLYLVERAAFHFVRTAPWPLTGDHPVSSPAALPVARKEGRSSWQLLLQAWDTVSKFSLFIDGYQLNSPDQSPNTHEKHTTIGSESLQDHLSKNRAGLPSMADWITLWKAWDTVTLEMIPRNMLHQKPIELRHACLFYLGHIPVFADIHLSRYFNVPNTEPAWFAEIFERGIDPNLDDPKKCNDHSPFPEEENQWPSLEEVLCFRDKLRQRLMEVYRGLGKEPGSQIQLTRRLGRVLAMIYEHEAMHLETLLYMLQQSDFVHHPPGFTPPDWDSLAREWDATAEAHSKYSEPIEYSTPQTITIGHDDYEDEDFFHPFSEDHQYGWDNESPSRKVVVKPFKLESATITNQEYLEFVLEGLSDSEPIPDLVIPGSWVYIFNPSGRESEKHQVRVKTIYGRIEFKFAKHWPVQASGSQLERFAKRKGGRLPTADELRVFLSDNPISQSCQNPIGFSNWHPLPARRPRKGADGRWRGGWSGGVWEWSSTTFEPHPNFKPSSLYPGYSKDFFDGQHNVLVGGSWATIPRIAHRQSFVNWYQFKYPYVFAGARVAYSY